MADSEWVLVRRDDLADALDPDMSHAVAHARLRAALSSDQVEDVAQVLADLGRHTGPGGWPGTSAPGRVNEGHRQKARAVLGVSP